MDKSVICLNKGRTVTAAKRKSDGLLAVCLATRFIRTDHGNFTFFAILTRLEIGLVLEVKCNLRGKDFTENSM